MKCHLRTTHWRTTCGGHLSHLQSRRQVTNLAFPFGHEARASFKILASLAVALHHVQQVGPVHKREWLAVGEGISIWPIIGGCNQDAPSFITVLRSRIAETPTVREYRWLMGLILPPV